MRLQSLPRGIAIWAALVGIVLADHSSPKCRLIHRNTTNPVRALTVTTGESSTSAKVTEPATSTTSEVATMPITTVSTASKAVPASTISTATVATSLASSNTTKAVPITTSATFAPTTTLNTAKTTAVTSSSGSTIPQATTKLMVTTSMVTARTVTVTGSLTTVTSTLLVSVTNTLAQQSAVATTTVTPIITTTATTTQTTTFTANTKLTIVTVPTPAGFTPLGASLPSPTSARRKRELDTIQLLSPHSPRQLDVPDSNKHPNVLQQRDLPQPPPRFHLPESFLRKIARRAESTTSAQSVTPSPGLAVVTVTVSGGTSISVVTSTITMTPTDTRASRVTVTASTVSTTISISTVLKSTTVAGTVTATSIYYAACATKNFVSTMNGHPIAGYDPITDPGKFELKGSGTDYDCCALAMTTANSIFWFRSHQTNDCWVYSENACPATAWRGWIVTGSCSVCREQYTSGNSKCGSVVNEIFTGELAAVG